MIPRYSYDNLESQWQSLKYLRKWRWIKSIWHIWITSYESYIRPNLDSYSCHFISCTCNPPCKNFDLSGDVTTASCQNLNIDPSRTAPPKEVPSFFFGVVGFFGTSSVEGPGTDFTNGHRHLEESIASICGCFSCRSNKHRSLDRSFLLFRRMEYELPT